MAKIDGVLLMIVTASVLVGWIYGDDTLKRLSPGSVTMNPVTACSFFVAGLALCVCVAPVPGAPGSVWGRVAAAVVGLVGAAKLVDYGFGWKFNFDQILFREQLFIDHAGVGNQIAPLTGGGLVVSGVALWLVFSARGRFSPWAQGLALVLFYFASVSVIGYLYGDIAAYRIGGRTPMAFHTASCFCLLSVGIVLAAADSGIGALLSARTPGGSAARLLLPAAIFLPILITGLRLVGTNRGWFSPEAGIALTSASFSFVFTVLVWKGGERVDQLTGELRRAVAQAERVLEERERLFSGRAAALVAENDALRLRVTELEMDRAAREEKQRERDQER